MESKKDFAHDALRRLQRVAAKYARIESLPIPVAEGLEITTREAHAIQAVGERMRTNVTDLAAALGVTKSAASQMTSKLRDKGFLEKNQAPHSDKELQLALTPLGRKASQAHARSHGADREELMRRFQAFSLSQIATLSVLLESIEEVMDGRLDD
jgi:DNA-binding MarR family transcriptional regulator